MSIVLITPSNIDLMPYLKNYIKVLEREGIEYKVINWDRLGNEPHDIKKITYRDEKIAFNRTFVDYLKYSKFIKKKLKVIDCNKIIVFGLQLGFFLNSSLSKKYIDKMVLDIRDYHPILNFFNLKKLVQRTHFTVISSPGYKEWIGNNEKIIVNHNTNSSYLDIENFPNNSYEIKLSYIGSLTNLKTNLELIDNLKNSKSVFLEFKGEGLINESLEEHISIKNIQNVEVSGAYKPKDEGKLYQNTSLVNMLLNNNDINSKTCLSNRLYNAVIYSRPLLVFEGSYLAEVIDKYNLGLVVSDLNDLEAKILKYFEDEANGDSYTQGRIEFFNEIYKENKVFEEALIKFAK